MIPRNREVKAAGGEAMEAYVEAMAEGRRFCRKCPPGTGGADSSLDLRGYIGRIPEEERAPGDEYERRLSLCASCNYLLSGMCRLCGCYTELRAAVRAQGCPDVPARW